MAARRASFSLLSGRGLLGRTPATSLLRSDNRRHLLPGALGEFSTEPADEEPIKLPVEVKYTQLLINGSFVDAASGKTFPTADPRTAEVIARVAEGDAEDVNRAVAAARRAFEEGPWPRMTAYERCRVLLRFADLMEQHAEEIAALESWDGGKPLEQTSRAEVPMATRCMRYYAGWADKIHGLVVPADGPHHVQVLHEPIGVAGQIIPWNFPPSCSRRSHGRSAPRSPAATPSCSRPPSRRRSRRSTSPASSKRPGSRAASSTSSLVLGPRPAARSLATWASTSSRSPDQPARARLFSNCLRGAT